ncbi:MAG: CoA transferase [Oceanicaulis sp.]|jgi:crotonobetainyl-CoA:carnitine CoA-transferase CaiB-like acyl-CoA transferase|uniref:CaiB/BaiF CoA transferase family protein n=1 Tax=unclassified Oceanicaulis TaxID=2632123 RepID=UPI000066D69B|nr:MULTISPECIES: CaiB/BaiF CoA-transferase family protein [unclassified Oceanicaulis]EAP91315.1 L-carnitine dehydratase/bile acid-inducible protein F [Oceanicaulis sp. HTCC2633]MAB70014.1 CoA transferase [Oceanicaulis sp.]MBC38963.1 CoA transferase [Oceanicaulis sp.]MBG34783.1 CoA transferase [Oceanicaulis sp.]HBU62265.1 CoA transferase [Oceanicaulis sp.]|tara:strand:- start:813 stop:2021 length:1209 start_codon:yes stop_codon:yes gene_type:complete
MTLAPLSHIKVLDLSRVLAGPWCAQILGDLGADVIKVENPASGDDTRRWGPPFLKDESGAEADAAYYLCANRNKRSIAVNITDPDGQAILKRLAAESDVVIENYKTGGLRKYGLDYDSLSAINPDLVYCSVTGFGQTGPWSNQPGYDFLIQAMGGLMSVTGEDAPMKVGVPAVDLFTGVYAAGAVMAALIARSTGRGGQHIDMALFDVQAAMLANQAANYFVSGKPPGRAGNAHPNIVPYQDFPTADGRLAVAVGNDGQFQAFASALGRPEWGADSRFRRNSDRVANREILVAEITLVLATRGTDHWIGALHEAGVPCGPILQLDQVFSHEQARSRELAFTLPMTGIGDAPMIANPMRLLQTPPQYHRAPPRFAEHTQEVLHERLGVDENEFLALQERSVVR